MLKFSREGGGAWLNQMAAEKADTTPEPVRRKIMITAVFRPDGTRMIEDISESSENHLGEPIQSKRGQNTVLLWRGPHRERESHPQEDGLGRYPCPGIVSDIFRLWPQCQR